MGDYLRAASDVELEAVADELEERREMFTASVRAQVNDEFRRRRIPRRV
jgi:hypothetical protein